MDDHELKALWQTDPPKKEQPDFEKAFKGKSIGILEKLQKTVKWEHYLNIVVSILFVGFLLYSQYWWRAFGFGVFLTGIIIYYKKLYDKVTHITYTENVVEYLTDTYNTLKDFKKRYIIGLIAIFPIAYVLGFDLGYDLGHEVGYELHSGKEAPENDFLDKPSDWIIFSIVNLITIVVSAGVMHFIFQFFYGKHIKKIKEMLENLQSSETME